ncbi:MAG: HAMP domain-containing protein [Candidatus Brocadia sp.]|nr:MAG: HAMP domain-containing protein [Candidatus Brocadia sp.]
MSAINIKKRISIATKFNLLTIFIILITSAGISYFLIQNATSHIHRNLLNHGVTIAGMASQTSEYSIYTGDKESMKQIVENLKVDEDIAYVCLLDKEKRQLMCKSFKSGLVIPPIPAMKTTDAGFPLKILHEEFIDTTDGNRYISFLSPVIGFIDDKPTVTNKRPENQEVVGYVHLGLSLQNLHKRIQQFQITTLAFTFLFIFAGVILTLFLTRRITAPIKRLSLVTKKVSDGVFEHTVHVHTNDEIADLAATFNQMVERLRAYREEIESHNKELVNTNEHLLLEITAREKTEKALEEKTREIIRSNKDLEQFAYIVSHDLQEPLRKVLVFGDRLIMKHGKALNNEGCDYIERMKNAAKRMQTLITDLLAYSRVTTHTRPFALIDLAKLIQAVIYDLEIQLERTGGRVILGELPVIHADAAQMRQLFQNLIGNALKYHRHEVPPVIEIQAHCLEGMNEDQTQASRDNGFCEITVTDNGIGFDEKYAEYIFGVFQRLHRRDQYEGTGVGLSLCRKIVERHGGRITATSAPGKGAKFTIVLPLGRVRKREDHGKSKEAVSYLSS